MSHRDNISALRRSHDALLAVVARESGALDAQSGAAEWKVADVLGHLGSGAEIGFQTLQAGAVDSDGMPAIWDRWNAMSLAEKTANFVEADGRLVEAFEALDDDTLENRMIDMGFLPAPINAGTVARFRLSEHALHSWDVNVAFDPSATVASYAVPLLLEQMTLMAGFTGRPLGKEATITIETTGPEKQYLLELGEGVQLTETSATTDNRAAMPAEALLRLTAGRLRADRTPSTITIDGSLSLDDLRQVFPGF